MHLILSEIYEKKRMFTPPFLSILLFIRKSHFLSISLILYKKLEKTATYKFFFSIDIHECLPRIIIPRFFSFSVTIKNKNLFEFISIFPDDINGLIL